MTRTSRVWWSSPYLLAYVVTYAALLFLLRIVERFDVAEPLLLVVILGAGFSALAWWLTRAVAPLPFKVSRPGPETMLLAAYLMVVAAFIAWGLGSINVAVRAEPLRSVAILAAKLTVLVFIPLALLRALWGYRLRDFCVMGPEGRQHLRPALWMVLLMILFQVVFGRGLSDIRHSGFPLWALLVGTPLCYAWLVLEVGLVEELFFRALLQSRLSAWLRSETGGIVLASLLFGLAHAPGLYYRTGKTLEAVGSHPSWLMAVGYSVVVTSVAGLFLGVLWSRTRNLFLLMAVHAAGDLMPNLVPMLRNWL